MKALWAIQAIPERRPMYRALIGMFLAEGIMPQIVLDEHHVGPLASMEEALKVASGEGNGLFLIQDDAIVEPWAIREMERAIVPGCLTTFFRYANKRAMAEAYREGEHYLLVRDICGVANYYPPNLVNSYLLWAADRPHRGRRKGDTEKDRPGCDVAWRQYLTETGTRAWLTIPNLAQHGDAAPSSLGFRFQAGANTRRTILFGEHFLRQGPWDSNKARESGILHRST